MNLHIALDRLVVIELGAVVHHVHEDEVCGAECGAVLALGHLEFLGHLVFGDGLESGDDLGDGVLHVLDGGLLCVALGRGRPIIIPGPFRGRISADSGGEHSVDEGGLGGEIESGASGAVHFFSQLLHRHRLQVFAIALAGVVQIFDRVFLQIKMAHGTAFYSQGAVKVD